MCSQNTQDEISLAALRVACSACTLHELCLPAGLAPQELDFIDRLVGRGRRIRRGEYVYRAGEPLQSLFAVRSGFLKSCVAAERGREQVTGFFMMGEVIGLEALSGEAHTCDMLALEDSELCEIPYAQLEEFTRRLPRLQRHLHRLMSREIVRDHNVMLLLAGKRAEQRLAAFLVNLSERYAARGFSGVEFNLRMTRDDIGSYLGLKPETVSRALSDLRARGVIAARGKRVRVLDPQRLKDAGSFSGAA